MQPYGTTNEPGTCLWCGRALRRPMTTVRGPSEYPQRSKCCNAPLEPLSMLAPGTMLCSQCYGYPGRVRPVLSKTPRYAKPGNYGDGHFCGLNCGYMFGRTLANGGRRLQPKALAQ